MSARTTSTFLAIAMAVAILPQLARADDGPIPDLAARLAALDPSNPRAYFELAEEVAYEIPSTGGQTLARTLFVLAMELDRRSGDELGLAHGACLALADMTPDPTERRWLIAIARSVAVDHDAPAWTLDEASTEDDQAPIRLADAMAEFRAGRRQRIKRFVDRDQIERMLVRDGLDAGAADDVARTLERDVRSPPPSMAGGERTVRDPIERGKVRAHPDNGGNPGPALNAEEMLLQLRAEAVLLGADPSSWAARALIDGGEPLRSIEPEEVGERYRVDVEAVFWTPSETSANPIEGSWSSARPAPPPAGAGE